MIYKSNQQLKQEAKQALSGKWGMAVLMMLFTFVITFSFNVSNTPQAQSIAFTIVTLVGTALLILLNVGILSFLMKICCGQKDSANFSDLFYGFRCNPGKAILLYLLNILYLLPGALIYAIALAFLAFSTIADGIMNVHVSPALFLVLFIIIILFIIYACYIQLTYGLVYFLLLDYPDLSVSQIWKRSAQLMKGNRWRWFKLELSFIPWAIACIFTLGIGFLWLGAYMNATYTEFYLDLVQQQAYSTQAPSGQTVNYAATDLPADTSLTHDCETTHANNFEKTEKDYSGIDPNTFK